MSLNVANTTAKTATIIIFLISIMINKVSDFVGTQTAELINMDLLELKKTLLFAKRIIHSA